ncbi:U-box domain-containing protein 33-like [Rhodamnia argentea]|uniref:RING-type E3 ubiquitin transferase n=1 Tax=Rhodamnia argentea TaxID=178133 RepID=A0ABM3HWM4_9MYRT|nr:U-box domain-containing protein 33-like [Rhodamnia argentea]
MTSRDVGSPSSGAVLGNVYVAVGSDAAESETTLLWALQNFGGEFKYCVLHVRQPEFAMQTVNEILDVYVQMCNQAKVSSMKIYAEMQDVGQGIVELIEQHCIGKLVMGAAANCHYIEGMAQLKSTKAMFVNEHAHPSCEIWFICRGNPVYLRESRSGTSYSDIVTSSQPVSSHVQSGQSTPGSDNSASDSSEVVDNLGLVQFDGIERSDHSSETNQVPAVHQPPSSAAERSNSGKLCEQLDRAMSEVTKAKTEALEELICRHKAEKAAIEAKRKVAALENLHAEELSRRINLEEMLEKERERREMIENEKNDLQMLFENALKANEELSANQASEPSSSNRQDQEIITKFSFSEIQEATENFDPSSKIEEGDYGSTYEGFLRHTRVAIKMVCSDSSQGPSQYHQEVHIASMLRHPNLVSLIGVCPEAWALIYEYLPNGNLEDRLSCRDNAAPLSWQTRIQICRDTCAALIFLHSFEPHGISHGDLTPRNILLDANFAAKLSDFGSHDTPFSSCTTGDFSAELDIYSFGVVLLRLLTGQAALNLDEIVQNSLDEDELDAVLDQTAGQWPLEQVKDLARLALSCCEIDVSNRPDLRSEVWPLLEQIQTLCAQASSTDHSSPEEPTRQSSSSDHSPGEEHAQPPSYFFCPIKHELMDDPLVAADGYTYEAEAIREWLNGHSTSPMTNLRLENLNLVSNRIVRSAIQEWVQSNGS